MRRDDRGLRGPRMAAGKCGDGHEEKASDDVHSAAGIAGILPNEKQENWLLCKWANFQMAQNLQRAENHDP